MPDAEEITVDEVYEQLVSSLVIKVCKISRQVCQNLYKKGVICNIQSGVTAGHRAGVSVLRFDELHALMLPEQWAREGQDFLFWFQTQKSFMPRVTSSGDEDVTSETVLFNGCLLYTSRCV